MVNPDWKEVVKGFLPEPDNSIGRGCFGDVYKFFPEDFGLKLAVKVISVDEEVSESGSIRIVVGQLELVFWPDVATHNLRTYDFWWKMARWVIFFCAFLPFCLR